jgi:cytochrome P450
MLRGDLHQRMHAMHEKFGPVIRLAPDELSYIDAQAWKDIYGNRPGHLPFERNRTWFKKISPDEPNSIMGPEEVDHARFRKVLVHAFSDKSLREQASMIESYVNLLITRLKEKSVAGPVDLVEWLNFTTFDIAGDLCFGESFDNLQNGKAHPWVEISYDFGKGLAMIASVNYYPPVSTLLKYILPEKVRKRMLDHRSMTHEKVAKRLELSKARPDFISTIQGQGDLNQERAMAIEELDINMSVLIFAGSETTASGLAAIIRILLQNEHHMSKLVREIRSAFVSESEINLASAGRLQYLNACVDEGMRLCPPVSIGVPRVVPPSGDTICGQWIPGGVSELATTLYSTDRYLRHLLLSTNFQRTDHRGTFRTQMILSLRGSFLRRQQSCRWKTQNRHINLLASAGMPVLVRAWLMLR